MSEPFLAEIRIVAFSFAPRGWAACDGQILPINQNQSLFSLLGTAYGGDGETSFALPGLRGRTPIHVGASHALGQSSGTETVTIAAGELPTHSHAYRATCADATSSEPTGAKLAPTATRAYRGSGDLSPLRSSSVVATGGGQAHNNMQPYLTVNFVIALQGLFPSRP